MKKYYEFINNTLEESRSSSSKIYNINCDIEVLGMMNETYYITKVNSTNRNDIIFCIPSIYAIDTIGD